MPETEQLIPTQDKESIELVKTTRGYTWSIKIKNANLSDADLERLSGLDAKLKEKYGAAQ